MIAATMTAAQATVARLGGYQAASNAAGQRHLPLAHASALPAPACQRLEMA
jgi:hypothetical protein